jgi:hypothetical protein
LGRALRQLAHKRKIGPSFSCLMRRLAHEKNSQALQSFISKLYHAVLQPLIHHGNAKEGK